MKKKVLFTATVDSHIKNFHLPYLKYFKDNGYEVHVATNGKDKIPHCDVKHTVSFERSPFRINNLKARKQLKKIIDSEGFEIIHTHTPMGSVITRLAALKARKAQKTRVIYTAHGFHFYKGAPIQNWVLYYPVEKFLARYTDTLITINKEDYQRAKSKFKTRVEYVPGVGLDEKKFDFKMTKKEKSELRKSLGLKDTDYVLICVAELNKNKNQKLLIDAMSEVVKKNKDIHLLLVGIDSYNGKHKKQVTKLGLEGNVHFLGFRKDVPRLLKASDLALSFSIREGLGLNILEALYSNLPCFVSNNRGHNDIVESCSNSSLITIASEKKILSKNILSFFIVNTPSIRSSNRNVYFYSLKNTLKLTSKIYGIKNCNNSRCVFIHDFKFYKKKDLVYGPAQFSFENLWKDKFLSLFDELNVVARGYELNNEIKKSNVRIDGSGVEYISTESLSSIMALKNIKKVKSVITESVMGADLVVVRVPSLQGILACGVLRKTNQPYVVEVVGNSFESYWYYGGLAAKIMALPYHLITKRVVKAAPNVIYVTKKYLQEVYPNYQNNIFCSSVKIEEATDDVLDKRLSKINEYNNEFSYTLGLVGPYNVEYKGHKETIEAISLLNNTGIKVRLRLLGGGSNSKLIQIAKKATVNKLVVFDKPRPAGKPVSDWLDGLDILLVPSKTEGLPRIMLEGMARGVPIIATSVGDIPNILNSKSMIKDKFSPEAIFSKIFRLLANKSELEKISVDNYKRASSFDYKIHLNNRLKFLREIDNDAKSSISNQHLRVYR